MRITGGILCGRRIEVPDKGVRPTKDRVRESLFAMLGDSLNGARVLDLFAGSGSLGLEALSRGAAEVCWVERDRRTFRILRKNVQMLGEGMSECRLKCICSDALRFLKSSSPSSYSLIVADPPYAADNKGELLGNILSELDKSTCMAHAGIFVYEMGSLGQATPPGPWRIIRDKKWGETRVLIMAREEQQS